MGWRGDRQRLSPAYTNSLAPRTRRLFTRACSPLCTSLPCLLAWPPQGATLPPLTTHVHTHARPYLQRCGRLCPFGGPPAVPVNQLLEVPAGRMLLWVRGRRAAIQSGERNPAAADLAVQGGGVGDDERDVEGPAGYGRQGVAHLGRDYGAVKIWRRRARRPWRPRTGRTCEELHQLEFS